MISEISPFKDFVCIKVCHNRRVRCFGIVLVCPCLYTNRTSKELQTLLSLFFFFEIWASKSGVRLIYGCGLYTELYGISILERGMKNWPISRTEYHFECKIFLKRGPILETQVAHTHPNYTWVPPRAMVFPTPFCSARHCFPPKSKTSSWIFTGFFWALRTTTGI